jgi:hypothetical protein
MVDGGVEVTERRDHEMGERDESRDDWGGVKGQSRFQSCLSSPGMSCTEYVTLGLAERASVRI